MQEKLKIKIKKLHPNAVIPSYSNAGDAGLDLTAISVEYNDDSDTIDYETGIAVEIPEGYVGLVFPRSSISKQELLLTNSVGVIDSGYRGSIKFKFIPTIANYWNRSEDEHFQYSLELGEFEYYETAKDEHRGFKVYADIYKVGDRVGQLIIIPYPQIEFEEAEELSQTERGGGGFGSIN